MSPASAAVSGSRRVYIDWARGVAVLIMIEAHTLDAWTRVSGRQTVAYGWLSMLGGLAAPLFLFLAGLSLVLAAEQRYQRYGARSQAAQSVVKRGAEIFILAFLFRLQAFVVSPGSWPVSIFKVDVLNVMGPAVAVAGVIWGLAKGSAKAAIASAAVAMAIAMTTPMIRVASWVGELPLWFQWYLRPFADQTTFTLFPWAGFVFAGTALGAAMAASSSGPADDRRLTALMALTGAAFLWLGFYTASLPTIYRSSSFWTSSPTFFAIRIGLMLLLLVLLRLVAWAAPAGMPGFSALAVLGRNSLFIYWIHVELVYGYATWAIHRRLPLWGTALAFLVFTLLMYRSIGLRDHLAERWRLWRSPNATPTAATA